MWVKMKIVNLEEEIPNESFSPLNQVDSQQNAPKLPDPYKSGKSSKFVDFILGFIILPVEVLILFSIKGPLSELPLPFSSWMIIILFVIIIGTDIILIVRCIQSERDYLIYGLLAIPGILYCIIKVLIWFEKKWRQHLY